MTENPAMQKVLTAAALLNTAEYERPYYHVVVDDNVTLADLLRPGFWAHHTNKLKPGGMVDVVRKNMTLDVSLRVISTGNGFVNMRVIRQWEDEEVAKAFAALAESKAAQDTSLSDTKLPPEYKISETRGAFTLVFVPTNSKLESNLKSRAAAINAAKVHADKAGISWPTEAKEPETVT